MSIIVIYLVFSMLAVIWLDITRFTIPNWLNGSLIALYPVALLMTDAEVPWHMDLVGMLIVFGFGYFVFSMKWMGGGDVKLITATSLWIGLHNLVEFILVFGVLGGALSIGLWGLRKALPHMKLRMKGPLPRILKEGAPVPYGVAIAAGFLIMVYQGKIQVLL